MPISKNKANKKLVIDFHAAKYNLSKGAVKLLNYIWDLQINDFPTDTKIAEDLGISRETFYVWRRELWKSGVFPSDDKISGSTKKE